MGVVGCRFLQELFGASCEDFYPKAPSCGFGMIYLSQSHRLWLWKDLFVPKLQVVVLGETLVPKPQAVVFGNTNQAMTIDD